MTWQRSRQLDHPYLDAFLIGASFTAGIMTAATTGFFIALFLLNHGVLS